MNIHTSNRLTDLSERIRQASDRAKGASLEAAEQYLEAGRLLIEARAECPHGDWLHFLKMTGVHERQARRLMQLARSGLTSDTVSDLGGVKAALEHLAEQKRSEIGSEEWAENLLHGPFSAWDMEVGGTRWLESKVMRQVKVPPLVAFAIDCHDEYKLPVLRLVSTGDLMAAMKVMAPIVKGEGALDFDMKSLTVHQVMALAINFSLTAKRIVVLLYDAIEYREGKDEARLMREARNVQKRLKAKLDARLVDIRECKIKADEMATIKGETVAASWLADQCERIGQTAGAS